jgi:prepilin-type N-terminal cleavage/methylation domain-containing protein
MKKYTKGFTLIELLVVIAIIGILASIVLVSLNSARNKGKDARIISDVQQVRTALESGYNGSGYPDLLATNANCNNNPAANAINASATFANCYNSSGPQATTLQALNTDVNSQGSTLYITVPTGATPTGYAIRGTLTATTGYFCIDSTGATNQADTGGNTGNNARCR